VPSVVQTLLLLPLLFLNLRALCDLCGEIAFASAFAIYYFLATIYFMFVPEQLRWGNTVGATPVTGNSYKRNLCARHPVPSVVQTLLLFLNLRALCVLCGEIALAPAVAIYYHLSTLSAPRWGNPVGATPLGQRARLQIKPIKNIQALNQDLCRY
jgi:hypothetical protein